MAHQYDPALFYLAPLDDEVAAWYPAGPRTLREHNPRLDSGVDIVAPQTAVIPAKSVGTLNLGVRAVCLRSPSPSSSGERVPRAFYLFARSSIGKTPLALANGVGLIDLGYRGPLVAMVKNSSPEDYTVVAGRALFQIAAPDLAPAEFEVLGRQDPRTSEFFGDGVTVRGAGGLGSTGESGGHG